MVYRSDEAYSESEGGMTGAVVATWPGDEIVKQRFAQGKAFVRGIVCAKRVEFASAAVCTGELELVDVGDQAVQVRHHPSDGVRARAIVEEIQGASRR